MTRIIAGTAGSLRLEVPKAGTRPTSDRVREAIFSALESWNLVRGSRVIDLYAGSGALGLEAASRGASAVVLVEKHPQAAQVAGKNAKTVQQAFGAEDAPKIEVARSSVQGYLELRTPGTPGGTAAHANREQFDVIMLDPPRKGCDETTLSAVVQMSPRRVVYVSCNPSTAARDAAWLEEHGYHAEKVQPVDLFPRTRHCECVIALSKGEIDS